ncbi:ribbon-helix-helix domain-containing protein [Ruegeria pomeroyi]|uniref:Ribbon-helix-helix domain-containing protein n=1 Tax=Ruegeria pomeroyi TaxID=89184 RepID=A0A9Q3WJW7_9RHOB|nr:ribbon-helix-helix domain-containing protein [Ruegeria pomeroyi]MCE8536858.1 ribbon-helix-helix domain-containing protein [Ruegeria pomeroyi]
MKSHLKLGNIYVSGKRTSIRLEPQVWRALKEIAARENCKMADLTNLISLTKRPDISVTSAMRLFAIQYFQDASSDEGHARAGHGHFSLMMRRAKINEEEKKFFSGYLKGEALISQVDSDDPQETPIMRRGKLQSQRE